MNLFDTGVERFEGAYYGLLSFDGFVGFGCWHGYGESNVEQNSREARAGEGEHCVDGTHDRCVDVHILGDAAAYAADALVVRLCQFLLHSCIVLFVRIPFFVGAKIGAFLYIPYRATMLSVVLCRTTGSSQVRLPPLPDGRKNVNVGCHSIPAVWFLRGGRVLFELKIWESGKKTVFLRRIHTRVVHCI